MEQRSSQNPAAELATILQKSIANHSGDTVCFLAGGSAFAIFDHLKLDADSKGRTIFCMGDERVSGESDVNNYLQLIDTLGSESDLQIIDTSSKPQELPKQFATRIKHKISEKLFSLDQPQIICILGIGTDGHTAGIFPMTLESFQKTYQADPMYVEVHTKASEANLRASLTPDWILGKANLILGYATGEIKCKTVIRELCNRNYELHEMPAQIIKQHKNSILFTDCV